MTYASRFALLALTAACSAGLVGVSCSSSDCTDDATCAAPNGTSSSSGSDGSTPSDSAGGEGAVGDQTVELRVDGPKPTLTHGKTERIKVTITRKAYEGPVVIKAKNLPPGITGAPLTIDPSKIDGDLELTIDKSSKQGDFTGATIEATDPNGALKASVAFGAFVRGSPGEIDTTFATNGIATMSSTSVMNVGSDGKIYVADPTLVRRLGIDGALDTTFGTNGSTTLDKDIGEPVAITTVGSSIYPAGKRRLFRLTSSGNVDTAFVGTLFNNGPGVTIATDLLAFAVAPDQTRLALFTPKTSGTQFIVGTFEGTGKLIELKGPLSPPAMTRAALAFPGSFIAVGGGGAIAKLKMDPVGYDTTFATVGYRVVDASATLTDVIRDPQGRFLVSGLSASKALILARVTPDGTMDGSLPIVTSSFVVKPYEVNACDGEAPNYCANFAVGNRLALQTDGDILQASQIDDQGVSKCVVVRYAPDGKLDTSFGNGGTSVVPAPGCIAKGVNVQPDGRIVVGGPLIVRLWN